MVREVALDTETTGLDPAAGHRIVEIACVELVNHVPSGEAFHAYVNPERDMPEAAFAVHGLSSEFLSQHEVFAAVVPRFLEFIGDAPLVIHNAEFDLRFINAELERLSLPALDAARAIDTLSIARRKYPGAQASLDALCRRFEIDLSVRDKHGALIDTQLLAAVYLELIGGRQPGLELARTEGAAAPGAARQRQPRAPRPHAPSEAEQAAHATFLDKLSDPIWRR